MKTRSARSANLVFSYYRTFFTVLFYALNQFSLRALVTTQNELMLIAAALNIGSSVHPKIGRNTPAASGIPIEL